MEPPQKKNILVAIGAASAAVVALVALAAVRRQPKRPGKKDRKRAIPVADPKKKLAAVSELLVNSNDEMVYAQDLSSAERLEHSYTRLASKTPALEAAEAEASILREIKQAKQYKEDWVHMERDRAEPAMASAVLFRGGVSEGLTATHDEEEEGRAPSFVPAEREGARARSSLSQYRLAEESKSKNYLSGSYEEGFETPPSRRKRTSDSSSAVKTRGKSSGEKKKNVVPLEYREVKNKKDYVFFDLFAMYAKSLIDEKRYMARDERVNS